ncbi:MAG: hypothetical protein U1F71_13365 [Verrucomicrobiaceae bacterium]
MTPPRSTILAPDRERAAAAAWGTLCILAVVQIVLAVKLMITRNPLDRANATSVLQAQPGMVPEIGQIAIHGGSPTAPPEPGSLMLAPAAAPAPVLTAPPPIGSFQQAPAATPAPAPWSATPSNTAPPPTRPQSSTGLPPIPPVASISTLGSSSAPASSAPSGAASSSLFIPAPQPVKPDAATQLLKDVNYVVTTAKEIRGVGDMNGALEMLKRADELTPDHPAIIAEIAQTYEQMGVSTKAIDNWRRIQLLGETKAGSYFELASRRLGAGPAAMAPATSAPSIESDKTLRLGACHASRDLTVSSGERYTLRVPIVRVGSQPVDGRAVNLEVFFFDKVNGSRVAQSIAPEPLESWQSAPVDWTGSGEEMLDVVYHLPALSAAEIQQHGRRSYHGYMLRLYYNNKLQDVAAEPRDLLEFGSPPGAASAGGNPLLPPVGR